MVGQNKGVEGKWQDIQDPRGGVLDGRGLLDSYWKIGNRWEGHKNNRDVGCGCQDTPICTLKLGGDSNRMI